MFVMFDVVDLQFRLLMAEEQIIVDRRRYSFAKTMETERRLKQEAAASWCSCSDIEINRTDFAATVFLLFIFNNNKIIIVIV